MRAFYFGCWQTGGHYLWGATMSRCWAELEELIPWHYHIDGGLCPGPKETRGDRAGYTVAYGSGPQNEGEAELHHKDGWTALSFWDRSVDKRHGSNSAFIFEGTHDFDTALELARKTFPQVMARFTFEIRLGLG